jgi:hypothetical protein
MSDDPKPSAEGMTPGEAEGTRRSCLDDPAELRDRRICLNRISKNLEGDLRPREDPVIESCGNPDCNTLKAFHRLELNAALHEECDEVRELDGTLAVPDLVHAYQSGDFTERGVHVGTFEWRGAGVIARGSLSHSQ